MPQEDEIEKSADLLLRRCQDIFWILSVDQHMREGVQGTQPAQSGIVFTQFRHRAVIGFSLLDDIRMRKDLIN